MRFPTPTCWCEGPRQTSGLIGQRWKHSNVLASRLVLIGQHYTQPQKATNKKTACNHYTNHTQPTPPNTQHGGSGTQASDHSCGGHSSGETPGNIPNPEAKPTNANGTAPDRVWESRTPPQHNSNKPPLGPPLQEGVYHCAQTQNTKRKTENSMHAHSKFNILTHGHLPGRSLLHVPI